MIKYKLIKSQRKTVSLTIGKELNVIIKSPVGISRKYIDDFVSKNSDWIEKHKAIMEKRNNNILSLEEIEKLKLISKEIIPMKVKYYSDLIGVIPTGVKITSAISRWGSCSRKNSLCFSYRIMLLPENIIDYIVVHELSHIRVKNHSKDFYKEVEKYMPDYKIRVGKLKKLEKELPR